MRLMTDSFLALIDFEMFISDEEFNEADRQIKRMIALKFSAFGQVIIPEKYVSYKKSNSNQGSHS
jgi:hypothetical protein